MRALLTTLLLFSAFVAGCGSQYRQDTKALLASAAPLPSYTGSYSNKNSGKNISSEIIYLTLVAELAISRGEYETAVKYYLLASEVSQDKEVANRATKLADSLGAYNSALTAAKIWYQSSNSLEALQALVDLNIKIEQPKKALELLNKLYDADKNNIVANISNINSNLANNLQQEALLSLVEKVAAERKSDALLYLAASEVAYAIPDQIAASDLIAKSLEIAPKNIASIILNSKLLFNANRVAKAIEFTQEKIALIPSEDKLKILLAELYIETNNYNDAKVILEKIENTSDYFAKAHLYLGQIYFAQNQFAKAENSLNYTLEDNEYSDSGKFFLARLFEEKKDYQQAIHWFLEVRTGKYYISSRVLGSALLAEVGKIDKAISTLQHSDISSYDDIKQLTLAQADIYLYAKLYQGAYDSLSEGLKRIPNDIDMLYARGIIAEELGRLDVLEQDLLTILKLSPNNIKALNALGYTLANKTERFGEAYGYINQALLLEPNNPSVLDSMGWLHYRSGKYEQAKNTLTKAFEISKDSDIALHLSEVLWHMGNHEQAKNVLQEVLKLNPEQESLKALLNQYNAKPTFEAANQIQP